ncbi:hypothetical protein F751_2636 [Auxenochlorella protothecoides]|uniref:Uncharacterized protein n=1 Tax=Auxenochlorella protothecoides TaxID=3075 RepID=A0A087SJ90_AUXPR|nr:hypothetical protein F751_2636 [Auxenochlorella protothecoides]KFM25794.1 hypothetical protein F751_2636 [Auxenochlorella protothecoides]
MAPSIDGACDRPLTCVCGAAPSLCSAPGFASAPALPWPPRAGAATPRHRAALPPAPVLWRPGQGMLCGGPRACSSARLPCRSAGRWWTTARTESG